MNVVNHRLTRNSVSSSNPTGPCASCFNFCVESTIDLRQSSRSLGRLPKVSFSKVEYVSPLDVVYSSSRLALASMPSAISVSDAISAEEYHLFLRMGSIAQRETWSSSNTYYWGAEFLAKLLAEAHFGVQPWVDLSISTGYTFSTSFN